MKKLMNPSVNHTTGSVVTTRHFHTLLRMTEVYLIFAEAANEAWGPDGQGTVGYSARDVIARIRSTGGITPDQYLPTVATQADMRRLIRNERRLELAYENQRNSDLRRRKDEQPDRIRGRVPRLHGLYDLRADPLRRTDEGARTEPRMVTIKTSHSL